MAHMNVQLSQVEYNNVNIIQIERQDIAGIMESLGVLITIHCLE